MKICEGVKKDNENTVKFYESFETKKEFAIVIEYCVNNLKNYLKENLDKLENEEKF